MAFDLANHCGAPLLILGVNAYHPDSAACLVADGQLVAAVEEERFERTKHWSGFPAQAVAYCLGYVNATLGDLDGIAINTDPKVHRLARLRHIASHPPRVGFLLRKLGVRRQRHSIVAALSHAVCEPNKVRGRVWQVEHHLAHLASAHLASPFERSVTVSIDGFGDFVSAAWGVGEGAEIRIDGRVRFPHSIGLFYEAMSQFLGFHSFGDEYKVMGLAGYGEAEFMEAMEHLAPLDPWRLCRLNLEYFRHHRHDTSFSTTHLNHAAVGSPASGTHFSERVSKQLGPAREPHQALEDRHRALAASTQAHFERALFGLLTQLHRKYEIDTLTLAGGCAQNSAANGRIFEQTPFRALYVPPASGDAGGAVGAALSAWYRASGAERSFVMSHASFGPEYDGAEIARAVARFEPRFTQAGITIRCLDKAQATERAAVLLTRSAVVGWFQGRMEWGPRALGNRSILCDPRRGDARELLNRKIKRREDFRPFAPAILESEAAQWLDTGAVGALYNPFMSRVVKVRSDKRDQIPAITHVDGTARAQTVSADANPQFHALIETFYRLTGVPMVLNTSFNESEPIVCRPEEAIECFLRTKMDALIIGNHCLERRGGC